MLSCKPCQRTLANAMQREESYRKHRRVGAAYFTVSGQVQVVWKLVLNPAWNAGPTRSWEDGGVVRRVPVCQQRCMILWSETPFLENISLNPRSSPPIIPTLQTYSQDLMSVLQSNNSYHNGNNRSYL